MNEKQHLESNGDGGPGSGNGECEHLLTCWNCKQEIEDVGMNCPFCKVFIDRDMMDRIPSIKPGTGTTSPILPGTLVAGRYEIEKEIGRGGMGIVYKARDNYMDRDVALKVIPRELSMDPKAIADLKRETSLALELTHENIVRLYNLDTWNNNTFVTMEYVPGGTLSHLMVEKGGSLSLEEALPLLRQTADALDYTHSKNPPVVHLDLKPLNILITQDGSAKVADYGLARVLRDLATRISAWEAAGTLAYMAPEQIRGKGIGPWTDLYALAAMAYELLSGQPPFYTGDLRWQIMHEEVLPIDNFPDHVNKALLAGLAKDASRRPPTSRHLVEMLAGERPVEEDAEEHSDEAEGGSAALLQPIRVETRKKSWTAALGYSFAVFLLMLMVAGGIGWRYYGDELRSLWEGQVRQVFNMPMPSETKVPPVVTAKQAGAAEAGRKDGLTSVFAGELSISSKPAGAEVYVSNEKKGVTPFVLKEIPNGRYALQLKMAGYRTWETEVNVSTNKKTDIYAELKPEIGGIELAANPDGSDVFIDGRFQGKTPLSLEDVDAGSHLVEIKQDGYQTWSKKMNVKPGEVLKLSAVLADLKGGLRIFSDPGNAEVYVEGKIQGTTPLLLNDLPAGAVKMTLKKDCYEAVENEILVASGRIVPTTVKLKPACGGLQVNSQPAGAKWFVDGQYMGVTPGEMSGLKNGKHLVKLFKKNLPPYAINVNIQSGKTEKLYVELAEAAQSNLLQDPASGMEFVYVEKGCYMMGSPMDEEGRNSDEGPLHEACIDGFWIAKHEVTQGQWKRVMDENPSFFVRGDDYPVENVSWHDVQRYIKRLNEMSGGKEVYRLPTEAEWEFACRSGGKEQLYSGGSNVDRVAWYRGNSNKTVHAVGGKASNGLGLFDMSGNVYEWVADSYSPDAYKAHDRNNPTYQVESDYKVCRGGSWLLYARDCRSANRSYYFSNSRNYNLGFRLVKNTE